MSTDFIYNFGLLASVSNRAVLKCDRARRDARDEMLLTLRDREAEAFARLALGIDDPAGNYSAAHHGLGPEILTLNTRAEERVMELALRLQSEPENTVPQAIREAGLTSLSIGVGSELSSMLRPDRLWVCNIRTLWTELACLLNSFREANKALKLYRESMKESELSWRYWFELHPRLGDFMKQLCDAAIAEPNLTNPEAPDLIWADAICNVLYDKHARLRIRE